MNRRIALFVIASMIGALPIGVSHADCPADPYPCGDEWPNKLEGPFALREVRHVQVPSHDGVMLDGWLSFPDLPPGVRAPVILISTPYLATVMVHPGFGPFVMRHPDSDVTIPGSGGWWDEEHLEFDQSINGLGVFPIRWIRRGFVLANFSVRGTGHSEGCFDTGGHLEQRDQKVLVDWLASQEWSNGRVGMGGLSYPGWTTWQGAVQAPASLKAIASLAPVVDYFEFLHTPQAARVVPVFYVVPPFVAQYSNPAVLGYPSRLPGDVVTGAACTDRVENAVEFYGSVATGVRSQAFFEERDLTSRLSDVRAAVLQVQGFGDPGHFTQDRLLTRSLDPATPFRELRGWWGHEAPDASKPFEPPPQGGEQSWEEIVTGWFDYWLKGIGPQPRLGVVDHQDQAGEWHESTAWPPPEASQEALFLSSGALATAPGGEATTFRSIPPPHELAFLSGALGAGNLGGLSLCGSPPGLPRVNAVYLAEASSDVVIAGNPYLDIRLSSDLPGGVVAANIYDLGPDFRCAPGRVAVGATWLATGAVDLEYYETRYEPRSFAVNVPTNLRIDLTDVTAVIKAGHRIAVVLGHGEMAERLAQPGRYPNITVYADSQIVLPTTRGSFVEAEQG